MYMIKICCCNPSWLILRKKKLSDLEYKHVIVQAIYRCNMVEVHLKLVRLYSLTLTERGKKREREGEKRERDRETERDGAVACLIKDGMYRRCRCSYY